MIPLVSLVLAATACGPRYRAPQLAPPGESGHESVVMRFFLEAESGRQKGRLVMDVDGRRGRVLFLNPLNRVVMDLHLDRGEAVLVNRRRQRYWRGSFRSLTWRMWRLRLEFSDLRAWLFEPGGAPASRLKEGVEVEVERDAETGLPRRLVIHDGAALLRLSVLHRRRVAGSLVKARSLQTMRVADLEDVIARDD